MATTRERLLEAGRRSSTTFEGLPPDPVALTMEDGGVAVGASQRVLQRYRRHGFVVVELDVDLVGSDHALALAASLELGEPFVPPMYSGHAGVAPVSELSTAGGLGAAHPAFGRARALALHCDGTLQPLGLVKCSLLLCRQPAAEGGDTVLFNSAAAFAELVRDDPDAASALGAPGVLVRQANIEGCVDRHVGPAFAPDGLELLCGYSVSDTDSWVVPSGTLGQDLNRGLDFMTAASMPGSRHFHQLALRRSQALVFDNTRLAHGRTDFGEAHTGERVLYRSLHLQHPAACARSVVVADVMIMAGHPLAHPPRRAPESLGDL